MDTHGSISVACVAVLLCAAGARAQESAEVRFDNSGEEVGITPRGTTTFSFKGSNWTGGVVETMGILALYASGSYSYEIGPGGGSVTFDNVVDSVEFFYVHGFSFPPGTAVAFNDDGTEIGSAESNQATSFNDLANYVTIDPEDSIRRIAFSAGVIDNFSFTLDRVRPPPVPIPQGSLAISLEPIASGLSSPVALTHAGDGSGRLFIVDQNGVVRIVQSGELLAEPFLDVRDKIVELNESFDERGLLGLAFHPLYAENGRFFVRYSAPREGDPSESCNDPNGFIVGCHKEVLAEYSVSAADPNRADAESERIIFEVDEPQFNHNAGTVLFGPDGFLYFSLGDGGGAHDGLADDPPSHGPGGNGQNIDTALGSLLRIDVDGAEPYEIPADNPFVGTEGLDEIYAYGLRNPFKFSFDRGGSGELFLADVGQNLFEEVNVIAKGGNYGWVIREGAHCFDPLDPTLPPVICPTDGLIDPIAEYDHSAGIAVVGGFVYRGSVSERLFGKYVFGDFSRDFVTPDGRLFYLDADGDRSRILEFRLAGSNDPLGRFVLGFGEDEDGELYLLTSSSSGPLGDAGEVFHIVEESVDSLQVPGDCNQDGETDLSDAICIFDVLYTGQKEFFPCGDGLPESAPNITLLDWQPDGGVDLSDGVALLVHLFLSGPAHHLAVPELETTGCVQIVGCPSRAGCP